MQTNILCHVIVKNYFLGCTNNYIIDFRGVKTKNNEYFYNLHIYYYYLPYQSLLC